jgi:hypothetical protein
MRKANVMKLKLLMKLLLLAGSVAGFAPVAQAFYNPDTGRWLSRDPIEERGGRKLIKPLTVQYTFTPLGNLKWDLSK